MFNLFRNLRAMLFRQSEKIQGASALDFFRSSPNSGYLSEVLCLMLRHWHHRNLHRASPGSRNGYRRSARNFPTCRQCSRRSSYGTALTGSCRLHLCLSLLLSVPQSGKLWYPLKYLRMFLERLDTERYLFEHQHSTKSRT